MDLLSGSFLNMREATTMNVDTPLFYTYFIRRGANNIPMLKNKRQLHYEGGGSYFPTFLRKFIFLHNFNGMNYAISFFS